MSLESWLGWADSGTWSEPLWPQGAFITLPYCYLNSELQQALLVRWRRWRLVRRVEAEYNMKTVQARYSQAWISFVQLLRY